MALIIILWVLYPLDPVRRLLEGGRWQIGRLAQLFSDPGFIDFLERRPIQLRRMEESLAALETWIDGVIFLKARAILGLPYARPNKPVLATLGRSRSVEAVLLRFEHLVLGFLDIEHLALRRAEKLKRLAEDAPVALVADHRPPPPPPAAISILPLPAAFGFTAAFSGELIRAPPWLGPDFRKPEHTPTR